MAPTRADRLTGILTKKKESYGFIRADEDGTSYFLMPGHLEKFGPCWEEIPEGAQLVFTPIEHPRGMRAIEVHVVQTAARR